MKDALIPLEYKRLADKVAELPTLPTVVYEITELINNPLSSSRQVQEVMMRDQSLSVKVLKLANSAYYAVPGGAKTLEKAITWLGFDTISQLVITATVFDVIEIDEKESLFNLKEFWKHAVGVAVASETIAKFISHNSPSGLFLSGLIHDIGKIALYSVAKDLWMEACELAEKETLTIIEAEEKLKIPNHAMMGYLVAERWKLPRSLREVILYHHEAYIERRDHVQPEVNQLIDVVFLANILTHQLGFGRSGYNKPVFVEQIVLDRLRINSKSLPDLATQIEEAMKRVESFLQVIGGSSGG